jgi:hypothetical protein
MWIFICPEMLIVRILNSISCEVCFIHKYHEGKEVRICTTGRTLLAQGNLVVTRPVHAADGRDTAVVLATLQTVKWVTPTCIDTLHVLIPGVPFTTSRISSSTSGIPCWQYKVQSSHDHKGSGRSLQMFSYLNIFVLDIFLRTNGEPPEHYQLPNRTWNAYQLAQQLAITTHLTHNFFLLLVGWETASVV